MTVVMLALKGTYYDHPSAILLFVTKLAWKTIWKNWTTLSRHPSTSSELAREVQLIAMSIES